MTALASPAIPPMIRTVMKTPIATIPSSTRIAPTARGTPRRFNQRTIGEPTAAMIPAVISGITIVLASDSSQTSPSSSTIAPVISHDIIPMLRSQSGSAKTPESWAASNSTTCSSGSPAPPSRRRSRPRITA